VKQDAQRRLVIPPGSAKGCPHCGQWIAAYLSGWGTWATQKVGITQVLISAHEADRCYFSVEMAVRFALVLGISLDELLRPKAKKFSSNKPSRRVLRRLEQIEKLPARQQNYLLRTIDGFLRGAGAFDGNIWITCCSGRVQIWRINCWISGPTSTTIAPITHGKGERRMCQCHHRSPICARFAGNHNVEAYIRHPWLPEFSEVCAACDMQVSVGKNSEWD
jgi:hypothetical protein